MDQPNPFSCTYDSGKLLIETFGRGNLTRYLEPSMSQRNNFEREKLFREPHSGFKLVQNHPKNMATFREKNAGTGAGKDQKVVDQRCGQKKHDRFEGIDQISEKINGIIRSISISCQKRGMSSKKQLERCETAEKLHKLQAKYNNHLSENKHKSIERNHKAGLRPQEAKVHRLPNCFGQQLLAANSNEPTKKARAKESLLRQERQQQQGQDYDDINQRIQYINDKITKYEKKMAGYQEVYKTNKKHNQQYFKENAQLQELQPLESNRESNDYPKKGDHKSARASLKTSKGQVDKRTAKVAKQNKYVQSKDPFLKKQSYFNHKYKQLSTARQSNHKPAPKLLHPDKQESNNKKTNDQTILYKQSCFSHQKFEGELGNKSTFIKSLIKQIALDQDFRHAKHMFGGVEELFGQSAEHGNKKWVKLQSHLQAEGLSFSINEVKQIFMPRDDEIDPFASVSHSHEELVHGIIFAYQTCEKHWNDNFYHNWSFRQLKESNFTGENLDRGKKGYISLQDLTFYINTEIDGFYRNRDLMLIYNRIASKHSLPQKKVKYKEVIDHLLTS